MAERGMLPSWLRGLHARHGTPWTALLVNSAGVSLLIPFSFQELIELDMFLYAAALILEFAALAWLRFRQPEMARPYRVPFGIGGVIAISLPPVALCLISIALSSDATRYASLGGIAIGLIVYRCRFRPITATQPHAAPTE
jgi:amino acid transporter